MILLKFPTPSTDSTGPRSWGTADDPNAWQADDRVMGREEILVIMMGPSKDPHNPFHLKAFVHVERSSFHQAGEELMLNLCIHCSLGL